MRLLRIGRAAASESEDEEGDERMGFPDHAAHLPAATHRNELGSGND
jgi:hypothetical protein